MKLHIRRTPIEACIGYAIAAEAVREQTRIMRSHQCTEGSRRDTHETGEVECLDTFFAAPKGPDGEFPRYQEFHDAMCDNCKARLDALNLRRDARRRLGIAKRSVEAVGKRLQKEPEKDWERIFYDHTRHVGKFLSDMYAIMIEPLEGGTIRVKDMCAKLKKAALGQREHEHDKA